jgi:inosine-uridine nucleoside N-ribohydrolase
MKYLMRLLPVAFVVLACGGTVSARPAHESVPVIFDTDMFGDIDDVLALAMLHALQDRGEVRLLAVTTSTDYKWCAPFIDAIDTYYGHGDIPIGLVRGGVTGEQTWRKFPPAKPQANYTRYISELKKPDGTPRFPHRLSSELQAPEAVSFLRKTLAAQLDGSVVMIQVGFSTNLARLLRSKADAISPLNGLDLVKRKVRLLSVMAGWYNGEDGKLLARPKPEFNLVLDVPSAQYLFANWPTPIVDSGFEIGDSMLLKGSDIDRKSSSDRANPVSETYRYTDPIFRSSGTPPSVLHDHPTFDLTAVLYAARPDDDYFSLSQRGKITISADGSSRFEAKESGAHRYLTITPLQRARALEAMTALASQPVARTPLSN